MAFNGILNFRNSCTRQGEKSQCLLSHGIMFKRKRLESSRNPEEDVMAGDVPLAPGTFEGPLPAFLTPSKTTG